jgi:hypothetical protein
MNNLSSDKKSCDPQLLDEALLNDSVPQKDWGLDQLSHYARTQNAAITRCEHSLTTRYWHLGLALNLARPNFCRGQWGPFLQELGVDKTRASKACAIHRTFKSQKSVKGLSVQEAYQRRKRKSRKSSTKKRRKRKTPAGLIQWLSGVCKKADFFLDEAAATNPNQAESLLSAIDAAIEQMTALRNQVPQRTDSA